MDIYLLYFLAGIHVYSEILEIYSAYILRGEKIYLCFIVLSTIFLDDLIYN